MTILMTAAPIPAQAQTKPDTSPAALVDALNATFGRHPGKRASHAKGICAAGEFVPAPGAHQLVRGALFEQRSASATVRFSVGGGNPAASDKSRSVRGLSMRLSGGGETYDLLLISEPVFFAATPESFVGFLQARVPDPTTGKPDPARIAAHNAAYPDGARQPALLAAHAAPGSYATSAYFSNHAFIFESKLGRRQAARIVAEPVAGVHHLRAEEEKTMPDSFLDADLARRLSAGPVEFDLFAQLPAPDDSLRDPSTMWRGDARLALGRLKVGAIAAGDTCDSLVFMPLNLPAGISASDDPLLHARAAAYAVSFARRHQR